MLLKSVVACLLTLSAVAQAAVQEGGETTIKRRKVVITEEQSEGSELGKNALAFEILGRGLLYGISYDRLITNQFALGIGYSSWGLTTFDTKINFSIIPVYANYYFQPGSHRAFVTGGAELVSATWDVDLINEDSYTDQFGNKRTNGTGSGSAVIPILGGGYEFRGEGGFLFRASLYELLGSNKAATWFGLSFGGAF